MNVPSAQTEGGAAKKAAVPAVPVSVAVVEPKQTVAWDEFSGRLEAVERVDVRSRVAGAVQAVHFREGALVKQGDLLVTIDPDPYRAEVDRLQAQVVAAEARLAFTKGEVERGQPLLDSRVVSPRDFDQRTNAYREADANLRAAKAALQAAQLNLGYTEVRAPVAGRVGRLEMTVGNLVAAGPGAPVLTTLVSVNPIYASFNADEEVVTRALQRVRSRCGRTSADRADPRADHDRQPARRADPRRAAADRQPGRCPHRHGARARRVREPGRAADARPVRAAAHGAAPRRRRWWRSTSGRSAPTRTRSS